MNLRPGYKSASLTNVCEVDAEGNSCSDLKLLWKISFPVFSDMPISLNCCSCNFCKPAFLRFSQKLLDKVNGIEKEKEEMKKRLNEQLVSLESEYEVGNYGNNTHEYTALTSRSFTRTF